MRETQQALAALYTDAAALEDFARDPDAFARRFGGRPAERVLRELDTRRLVWFARSLRVKRCREAEKLVPFVAAALGSRFDAEFLAYAVTAIPGGARKHLADAMAFCDHLVAGGGRFDRLVRDAARYERLSVGLDFVRRDGRVAPRRRLWIRITTFAYDLPALCAGDDVPSRARRRRTPALFVHVPGIARGVWYW